MKRLLISIVLIAMTSFTGLSKNKPEVNGNKFLFMSGYGYTHNFNVKANNGVNTSQSFIYMPGNLWGFGLDMGYSYSRHIEGSQDIELNSKESFQKNMLSLFNIGPSIYIFPLNTKHHRIYIGAGLDYVFTDTNDLYSNMWTDDPTQESGTTTVYSYDRHDWSIRANIGYTYKISEHFGIGIKGGFSWCDPMQVYGLLNLSFEI